MNFHSLGFACIKSNVSKISLRSPLRCYFSSVVKDAVIDLRSDTVTMPSRAMFKAAMNAQLGDDGEFL